MENSENIDISNKVDEDDEDDIFGFLLTIMSIISMK